MAQSLTREAPAAMTAAALHAFPPSGITNARAHCARECVDDRVEAIILERKGLGIFHSKIVPSTMR